MHGWLAKLTFAKLKLVKNGGISWGNAFSKTCSQWAHEVMQVPSFTLTCIVWWQMWPQDITDNNSKTKNLDPEYFCMLTPVGKVYNIYFRTFCLTCTVWWSKWPTCMERLRDLEVVDFFFKLLGSSDLQKINCRPCKIEYMCKRTAW
jgi:hypothetical protein